MTVGIVDVTLAPMPKKEYAHSISLGPVRSRLINSATGEVMAEGPVMEQTVQINAMPGRFRIVLDRLDRNGNPLPGSEWTSNDFDVNQMVEVPTAGATITVTLQG